MAFAETLFKRKVLFAAKEFFCEQDRAAIGQIGDYMFILCLKIIYIHGRNFTVSGLCA